MAIKINNEIYIVQSFHHHKPGKGAAIVRTKLKNLNRGTTLEKTFRSGETLEDVSLDKRPATFSYEDGDNIVFMDLETFDEISIPKIDISQILLFLKEGTQINVLLYENKPILIEPPNFIELKVTYAEDGIKGDTATNPTKEVELETGAKIQVPLFVKTDDVIKIDLREFSYVERVK